MCTPSVSRYMAMNVTVSFHFQVHTFDVSLDRGWHLRLGFSVCDPAEADSDSRRDALPFAAEVKAVYPGSLADKDGRIKVGDRIVEACFASPIFRIDRF